MNFKLITITLCLLLNCFTLNAADCFASMGYQDTVEAIIMPPQEGESLISLNDFVVNVLNAKMNKQGNIIEIQTNNRVFVLNSQYATKNKQYTASAQNNNDIMVSLNFITEVFGCKVIKLELDNKFVTFDNEEIELPVAPRRENDTVIIPLEEFIPIAFGAEVVVKENKYSYIMLNDIEIELEINSKVALVNRNEHIMLIEPFYENNCIMVPLRFLAGHLGWYVWYTADNEPILIRKLPPVANFDLLKTTVAQGETVKYIDRSYDPAGGKLTYSWEGLQRAFFEPGTHTVKLTVYDQYNIASKTYSLDINVTDDIIIEELPYYLYTPTPYDEYPEPYKLDGFRLSNISDIIKKITPINPTYKHQYGGTLLRSNSPETVVTDNEGMLSRILYRDTCEGDVRLYYHHMNGNNNDSDFLNIYILAHNNNDNDVFIEYNKIGYGGPSKSANAVGMRTVQRYLDNNYRFERKIKGKETIVLNKIQVDHINRDPHKIAIKKDNVMNEIYDIKNETKYPLELSFVVAKNGEDIISIYGSLKELEKDGIHIRGTFPNANIKLEVDLIADKVNRLVLADNDGIDGWDAVVIEGDENEDNGEQTLTNSGNFGVIYDITLNSNSQMAMLIAARGGTLVGAIKLNDQDKSFEVAIDIEKVVMLGILKADSQNILQFMPPAASSMPVNLIFIPYIKGDLNKDGYVNIKDISLIAKHYGNESNKENKPFDLNEDGMIDLYDYVLVSRDYNKSYADTILGK